MGERHDNCISDVPHTPNLDPDLGANFLSPDEGDQKRYQEWNWEGGGDDTTAFTTDQAKFIRIRVEVPLDKPIHRGGVVLSPEGDKL